METENLYWSAMASKKCVRCESLERKQASRKIYYINNNLGDKIPICSVCLLELDEEDQLFNNLDNESEVEELDD